MFDFDTIHNRRGTCSLKWNGREGEIPLWVADMDFVAAKARAAWNLWLQCLAKSLL